MNSNSLPTDLLPHLITISTGMVEAARQEDWEQVANLDALRRDALGQLTETDHAFDPGHLMLASRTLTELDEQVRLIVRQARDGCSTAHKESRDSSKAIRKYLTQQAEAV